MKQFSVRLFLRTMITYLAVILTILICFIPIYNLLLHMSKKSEVSNTISSLRVSAAVLDKDIQDISDIASRLFYQHEYILLSMKTDELDYYEYYTPIRAMELLREAEYRLHLANYLFVTFSKNDMVLDNERFYPEKDDFYRSFFKYPEWSQEEWDVRLADPVQRFWESNRVTLNGTYTENCITYNYPFPPNSLNPTGCLTALLPVNDVVNLILSDALQQSGFLYLTDYQGNLLLSHNYNDPPVKIGEGETLDVQVGGTDYTAVSFQTQTGLQIVVGIPFSAYTKSLEQVRNLVLIYVLIAIVIVVALSALFSYRSIFPLNRVIAHINHLGFGKTTQESVYDYIINTISSINISKNAFLQEVERMRMDARHSRMETFIRSGIASPEQFEEYADYFHLGPRSHLVLINVMEKSPQNDIMTLAAVQIIKEEFGETYTCYVCSDHLIVLFVSLKPDESMEWLKNKLSLLLDRLSATVNEQVRIVVSGQFSDITEVSRHFLQTKNYLSAGLSSVNEILILPQEYGTIRGFVEISSLNKLHEYILAGNLTETQLLFEEFFGQDGAQSGQDSEQIFYSVRGVLIAIIQKVLNESDIAVPQYDPAAGSQTRLLQACCAEICGRIDLVKKSHNTSLKDKIVQYLYDNYSDPDMSAAATAEHFGISKNYFSNFVREQTGKSYTEYIEEIRLQQAVELLKHSDRNINDVARDCGFLSQNTFYKAFKRQYHTAPSAMRQNNAKLDL